MINLHDASIADLLPEYMTATPETQALAYAVRQQVRRLMTAADGTMVWSNIDALDNAKLDALAAEMRVPNYSESYAVGVKRSLLKAVISYYMKAGTAGAMQEIIEAIFSNGKVVEWYAYGGSHHHFRVYTTNPSVSGEMAARFTAAIAAVKRKSTILDGVVVNADTGEMAIHTAMAIWISDSVTLPRMRS
ncbi:phage tail protein [Oscillibacter ruminantium]|uniref:phage tail protein n=1 Tax=Oscillibacter ruminantium TaxID=1263547 RepID=UPI0033303971